jgi:DNA-binding transcriptional LysR family regulator
MDWDDVRVLLALYRGQNLAAAGRHLGVDASTVSRRLAGLEKDLGTRLFTRTREGLRPTAAAEHLRARAEAMETDALALVRAARARDLEPEGLVRVATTEALARMLVAGGLLAIQKEHPAVGIELLGGNQPVDLTRGEADLAVRLAALHQPALRARCVATVGVGLFASSGYLAARGRPRTAAALSGHDVLLPTGELSALPEARWLGARPGVRVVFRSNSMPTLLAAAVEGLGLVPLPLGWGDAEPVLSRVLVLPRIPQRKVWMVTSEQALARPAVRVVSTHLAALLGRLFTPVR